MRRCLFISLLVGGVALALPLVATAQVTNKVYRIGYLNLRAAPAVMDEAFLQGLRDLGYEIGHNIVIEYRWANNDYTRLESLADELVRLNVDIIVTSATPAIRVAKRATSTIPIVMAASADPVGTGLVKSLAHPGENVTGLSLSSNDLAQKRLQLASELVVGVTRVAVLGQVYATAQSPTPAQRVTESLIAEIRAAGRRLGIEVFREVMAGADELPRAFDELRREQVDLLIVQNSPLVFEHRASIVEMAARQKLPAMYEARDYVVDGGLVSYGPSVKDSYRRAATYVDKILKGAEPGNLPVEQPTKFELVVNLRTAKALGLTIPQSILTRADEVIE